MNQLSQNKTWGSARISGKEISSLMRRHGWTISRLSQKMGITQKRVRDVKKIGVSGSNFVRDWLEAITGVDPAKRNPAYKGYRIGSTLMGETFIEKGGYHIAWANNVAAAKKIIDQLTKPAKKAKKNLVLERKYSAAARAYIARIIRRELKAGVPFNQAVAMAHSMARQRGYKIPARPNPKAWRSSCLACGDKEKIDPRTGLCKFCMGQIKKRRHGYESTPRRKNKKTTIGNTARRSTPNTPRSRRGVVIGDIAESITYQGGRGKKKNSRWVHKFKTPVQVLGMADGSIKLKSNEGFRLWDWF